MLRYGNRVQKLIFGLRLEATYGEGLHPADFVGAHRVLVATAGMSQQTDLGADALKELRRVQPNISLAWIEVTCQSSWISNANIIWRDFVARVWLRIRWGGFG